MKSMGGAKVSYFFFTWKRLRSLTHSISEKSVFFFPNTRKKKYSCIFFPRKKITLHSLTRFKPLYFFFPAPEKKNTVFLLTHTILGENVTKVIFSNNKKEYGTFAPF